MDFRVWGGGDEATDETQQYRIEKVQKLYRFSRTALFWPYFYHG